MNKSNVTSTASSAEMTLEPNEDTFEDTQSSLHATPDSEPESNGNGRTTVFHPGDSSVMTDGEPQAEEFGGLAEEVPTLSNGPLSPYDDEPSTLSALPAPRLEDSIQVWEPPSPTAWRKTALSHAGAAILGAAVCLGAIAATIGLSPQKVVTVEKKVLVAAAPQTTPPIPGMVPGGPGAPGVDPNHPLALGADGNTALPPGSAPMPGATANNIPNVPPGTGIPTPGSSPSGGGGGGPIVRGGGSIPPAPRGLVLPALTGIQDAPPATRPAVGLPTLPPGMTLPNASGRPAAGMIPPLPTAKSTPQGAKPKGPTAPSGRFNATGERVVASTVPPARSSDTDGDVDQAINRLKRSTESNPKDAAAQLQLEKLYRKKLIQADRVDEMEQYRTLADQARDRAKNILTSDPVKPAAPKPAAPKPAAPKPAASKPATPPASTETKSGENADGKAADTKADAKPADEAPKADQD